MANEVLHAPVLCGCVSDLAVPHPALRGSLATGAPASAEERRKSVRSHCRQYEYEICICGTHDGTSNEESERKQDQRRDDGVQYDYATPASAPLENGEESKDKECDYVLLTQIVDPKAHPLDPQMPQISIGGKVPSVDASDPPSGSSGPGYRDNLQISFVLFRSGRWKPVLDAFLRGQPSGNVSDSLLPAMDREANRVSHELNKK